MDRQIATLGSLPRSYEFNQAEQFVMKAIGYVLEAVMGSSAWAYGLACTPTSPASLSVQVGRGTLGQLSVLEATEFGSSLLADTTDPLMKAGINLAPTTLTFVAPAAAGQSQCFLIEGQMQEADGTPLVLPFYNAANPAIPFSGPSGSGAAINTQRLQTVALQVVPGAPAATGSQTTPGVSSGWVPLYVITLANGQTTITGASIAIHPAAPFVPWSLPQLAPGYSRPLTFTSTQNWVVPLGVTKIRVRDMIGGGGAGGAGGGGCGGGGGAGGYASGVIAVTPGETLQIGVGSGAVYGGAVAGTSFIARAGVNLMAATGGSNGGGGGSGAVGAGGTGGAGSNPGGLAGANLQPGGGGTYGVYQDGTHYWSAGGAAYGSGGMTFTSGSVSTPIAGGNGTLPGAGGAGGIGTANGGNGAAGLVNVEY